MVRTYPRTLNPWNPIAGFVAGYRQAQFVAAVVVAVDVAGAIAAAANPSVD